jgi:hypothetical protein
MKIETALKKEVIVMFWTVVHVFWCALWPVTRMERPLGK